MSEPRALLAAQWHAFMAELPVSLDARRDRLRRAVAMVRDQACDALSDDFGHRSREQPMLTDIAGSIAPLRHAVKHLDRWARRERRPVQFPLGLLGARLGGAPAQGRGRRDRAVALRGESGHVAAGRRVRRGQPGDGQAERVHPGDVARLAGLKPPYGAAMRKSAARQIG